MCDRVYIWDPSTCACKCDKLCDIGQYLDYKNCVCRKSLVDKLVEECINVIDGDTMYNETLTVASSNDCASLTPYILLFIAFLSITVIISGVFVYFHRYGESLVQRTHKNKHLNLKDILNVNYSKTETGIY